MNTMPGAPSELDVAKTQAAAMTEKGPTNKYIWYTKPEATDSLYEFPVVPFRADPHDDLWEIKTKNATGASGHNMQVMFTDADAQYQMRKRTDDEQARFDAWISQTFDLSDPAQNAMLQQIVPGLYQRREELIDHLQDLQTRYAKIRLRGAKSEDDLRFQWLLDTGRIQLPPGPIWDPRKWRRDLLEVEKNTMGAGGIAVTLTDIDNDKVTGAWNTFDEQMQQVRYQRGYFSPLKWLTKDNVGSLHKSPWFDVRGDGLKNYGASGVGQTRVPGHISDYPQNSAKFPDYKP